jgi:hypothetical protein
MASSAWQRSSGRGIGGGDGARAGLYPDGAVTAGGADELPACLDPAADAECSEDDAQVGLDGLALVVIDGAGCRSDSDIRKDFSISESCACRESRPQLRPAELPFLVSGHDDHRSCACGSSSS